jgi:hypothetical protein
VAFIAVNRSGRGAPDLLDIGEPVTDLRVETIPAPSVPEGGDGNPGAERGLPKDAG